VKVEDIDVGAIVDTLQARVADRRALGDYPPGLEEQLEAEFDQMMKAVHRHEVGTAPLEHRVNVVQAATDAIGARPEMTSRVPLGGAVHATAAKLVVRHTNELADTVRRLGTDTVIALREVVRLFDANREADERQLEEVISSVIDRLAVIDHLADAVLRLEARVAELEHPAGT
jgi:hypothetical protein